MSEQGYHWIESKMITDESREGAGFINKISADGGAVRVVWSHTIGGEKEGVFHPDGWESGITYAVGRDDNHYLQLWDEKPRQHGEIMILCNIFTPQQGEGYPMEPHRTFLYSGSDDETIRVWDLESHTCVSVIKTNHDNKVSDLVCTDSGRLVSASQDCTIKIW
jgi:WD40 repeat protein